MKLSQENQEAAYTAACLVMRGQVRTWRAGNPNAVLQMTRPAGAHVGMALFQALECGLVKVNDDTKRMFTELGWLRDTADTPTPAMAEMAMELS